MVPKYDPATGEWLKGLDYHVLDADGWMKVDGVDFPYYCDYETWNLASVPILKGRWNKWESLLKWFQSAGFTGDVWHEQFIGGWKLLNRHLCMDHYCMLFAHYQVSGRGKVVQPFRIASSDDKTIYQAGDELDWLQFVKNMMKYPGVDGKYPETVTLAVLQSEPEYIKVREQDGDGYRTFEEITCDEDYHIPLSKRDHCRQANPYSWVPGAPIFWYSFKGEPGYGRCLPKDSANRHASDVYYRALCAWGGVAPSGTFDALYFAKARDYSGDMITIVS